MPIPVLRGTRYRVRHAFTMPQSPCTSEATNSLASSSNHGGEPASAFSVMRSGLDVAGMTQLTLRSLRMNLSNACAHVRTPYGASGASASGDGAWRARALAERPHDDHTHAVVGRRRQELALGEAVSRVVRDLHVYHATHSQDARPAFFTMVFDVSLRHHEYKVAIVV
jgi:hypothetical protein